MEVSITKKNKQDAGGEEVARKLQSMCLESLSVKAKIVKRKAQEGQEVSSVSLQVLDKASQQGRSKYRCRNLLQVCMELEESPCGKHKLNQWETSKKFRDNGKRPQQGLIRKLALEFVVQMWPLLRTKRVTENKLNDLLLKHFIIDQKVGFLCGLRK